VPREQALKELSGVQGMAEVIAALGRNPLPDAFVVTPRGEDVEQLSGELARLPGVARSRPTPPGPGASPPSPISAGWPSGS
jgi:cell division protein FtsX